MAGVEVSLDQGTLAPGDRHDRGHTRAELPLAAGAIRARAVDDSANIGAAVSRGVQVACPCTVFGTAPPANAPSRRLVGVELGMRFVAAADGYVSGVRFYKGAANTGVAPRDAVERGGQPLAAVDVHRRVGDRVADPRAARKRVRECWHDVRRQLPGSERSLRC